MKLITERNFNGVEFLSEQNSETGEKQFYITGIYMQANKKNKNGRIYESKILQPAVDNYIKEYVETGRALSELEHPKTPQISLDRVSHRITEMHWDGDNVIGKALILNTPMGKIAKGLMEGGSSLGVSSRGMGSLEERQGVNYVKNDYTIAAVDIVQNPSAPDAWVNGILEGVEFIFDDDGKIIQKQAEIFEEKAERTIKKKNTHLDEAVQLKKLQRFLSSF